MTARRPDEETSEPSGTDDLQGALAKALKGQTWDTDKEDWAK